MKNHLILKPIKLLVSEHRKLATTLFLPLDKERLMQPRADDGWSISECLAHLNTYSAHYLPLITNALNLYKPTSSPRDFKSGWLGGYFVKMMDPDLTTSSFKAAKKHVPKINFLPQDEVRAFIAYQDVLLEIIEKCEMVDLNKIRISTSISSFITIKLGDTLKFLTIHNERHLRQAKKILSAEDSSALLLHA